MLSSSTTYQTTTIATAFFFLYYEQEDAPSSSEAHAAGTANAQYAALCFRQRYRGVITQKRQGNPSF